MLEYFRVALWCIKQLVRLLYLPIHFLRIFKTGHKCPPIDNNILLIPAYQLAEKIRKKELTSLRVIQAYIERVREVNPIINAVIDTNFETALWEAQNADALISTLPEQEIKSRYPLLGVPISVKGSLSVKGLANTSGRVDRLEERAVDDAAPVKRAREAGAIPILTSNVPELCLNWETVNKLVGVTRNPYDSTRTVGGSSGGECSLLASAGSVLGIGSDIAGSLRLPAHFCGVWGHKPSPLAISCEGHYPDCGNRDEWNKVFTLGPLARFASDLRPFFNLLVEPQMKSVLKLDREINVRSIRIFYTTRIESMITDSCSRSTVEAIDKVINYFDQVCSNRCSKLGFPAMKYQSELSYIRLLNVDDVENLFKGKGDGSYSELFRFLTCRSRHELTSITYGIIRKHIGLIPQKSTFRIYKQLEDLRCDFIKTLGQDGVFICPTFPQEAPYHGDVFRNIFNYGCLSIFNALGFPVTNCPVGFSNGLPIGLQVVAAPNNDRLTLEIAEEIERAFGGWTPPQDVDTNTK